MSDPIPSSSGAGGILVIQRGGHEVRAKLPFDPFGVWRRVRRRYALSGRQWFSPLGYYFGPFDDREGVQGSSAFRARDRNYGHAPQIYLTANEHSIGVLATFRGREPLWIPYADIESVEIRPGTTARKLIVSPKSAHKLGGVVVVTKDGRRAEFTGHVTVGLAAFLVDLGARTGT